MFATYLSTLPCEISEITILLCTIMNESSLELHHNCPVQLSMQSMLKYYRTWQSHLMLRELKGFCPLFVILTIVL